jgi:hypothetical protein
MKSVKRDGEEGVKRVRKPPVTKSTSAYAIVYTRSLQQHDQGMSRPSSLDIPLQGQKNWKRRYMYAAGELIVLGNSSATGRRGARHTQGN